MRTTLLFLALALPFAAAAHSEHDAKPKSIDYAEARETGFGKAFDPRKATRTIEIDMSDAMRFAPAEVTVMRGEAVRFVAKNSGKVVHEMVLGTMKELKEHAEHMKMHPDMEHDAPNMLHVPPGESGEMGWQFTRAGEFFYGCLQPGHFEAGMVGRLTVN